MKLVSTLLYLIRACIQMWASKDGSSVFCPFKIFFSLCFVSPGIGTFSTWTYVILHFFIHSNHIWFPLGVLERLATKALLELKQGVVAYINIRHVHGASVTCLSHV